jgi:eukaryotic translation initiation factor 2C
VICFGSTRDFPQPEVEGFLRELIETSNATGVNIAKRMPPVSYGSPLMDVEVTLKAAFDQACKPLSLFALM